MSPSTRTKYLKLFPQADKDADGYVSGTRVVFVLTLIAECENQINTAILDLLIISFMSVGC
jgi:Ca2+-binding EF-hand superfamily protein